MENKIINFRELNGLLKGAHNLALAPIIPAVTPIVEESFWKISHMAKMLGGKTREEMTLLLSRDLLMRDSLTIKEGRALLVRLYGKKSFESFLSGKGIVLMKETYSLREMNDLLAMMDLPLGDRKLKLLLEKYNLLQKSGKIKQSAKDLGWLVYVQQQDADGNYVSQRPALTHAGISYLYKKLLQEGDVMTVRPS